MSDITVTTIQNIIELQITAIRLSMKESNARQDRWLNSMIPNTYQAKVNVDNLREEEEFFGKLAAQLAILEEVKAMIKFP